MRYLYSCIFSIALPFIFLKLWLRGRKVSSYRQRWLERLAFFKTPAFPEGDIRLWIHTVSVGEFIAAKPLIQHYLKIPNISIIITTMTPTGSEQVLKVFGKQVTHVYAPYDLTHIVNRFLRNMRPDIYVIMETELWPNTIHCCKKKNIPIIVANARLSEKSARGYARVNKLSHAMLQNITCVAAQNPTDASRFLSLGLPKDNINITGSIKFDLEIDLKTIDQAHILRQLIHQNGKYLIWIAASTHHGEDEVILKAFAHIKRTQPNCRLILVPRHPDRFTDVYNLCLQQPFVTLKRSQQIKKSDALDNPDFDILLGDTMGELLTLFGCSDFAFIGGSFVNNGGHNSIEAAAWGLPIISGPSTFNFQEITQLLLQASALTIVNNDKELSHTIEELCHNLERRQQEGRAAKKVAEENKGALHQLINIIDGQL